MSFRDLKAGDEVTRMLAGTVAMKMVVCHVDDRLLYCRPVADPTFPDYWAFDRETGVEEDEGLGWGVQFRITGSYLVRSA